MVPKVPDITTESKLKSVLDKVKMQQLLKATSKLALCLVRINGNMYQFITIFNLSDKDNYLMKN